MNVRRIVQRTLHQVSVGTARDLVIALVLALALSCVLPSLNLGAGVAYAQNTNATIRGQVLDPSGAVVPDAQVVIVNENTNVTVFNGKSDSVGSFVAPQVIPGTYTITVSAPGLRQTVLDNVMATVAQVVSVNVKMQIGQNETQVTVRAGSTEELARSTSDISTLISPTEVQNLPLAGRSTENLLSMVPGVVQGGAANSVNTSQLSINGGRTLNTEVLLNGVSTIIASTGSPLGLPSSDGVDQFRVLATTAPAEYGRTSGAVISVSTRSGTNQYHGNLYSLARNEVFDANRYFNKLTYVGGKPVQRNRDRYFQEGGSLGGPVVIPHLYNGHNKTFFFVNYDYTISPSTSVLKLTVPTAAQRGGDLSNALATVDANGKPRAPQAIYQPTGTTSPAFANNQIDPALFDPAAVKTLALLPLPNTTGTYDAKNNRYTGNWVSQQNNSTHTLKLATRVDEVISSKDRISFNVYRYTTRTPNPVYWDNPLLNTTWDCSCSNAWVPSIDYTRVWSDSLVMDLNLGFFRNSVYRNPPGAGLNAKEQLGIARLPLDQTPQITDSAFSNIGADTNTNQVNITNTITPFGTVTKMMGAHTLKFGASLRKNQFNSYNPSASPEGSISFDGSITNHGQAGNPNTALADFLLGKVKTANFQLPMPPTGRRNYNLGIFFQDDYRITPKLTVNAGLRWEYESPMTIATNIYTRFDPKTGEMLAAGINASPSLNINTPKADFSPRVGFAYGITDKTVIRGAFGTFYGTIFQNLGGQVAYPGYDVQCSFSNLGTAVAQSWSLSQGFPLDTCSQDLSNPSSILSTATTSKPVGLTGTEFGDLSHMPLVEQWNVGVQRSLPLSLTLEVNYVGNHARNLPSNETSNMVPWEKVDAVTLANNTATTQAARPFPTLGSWGTINNDGRSSYNSLQVTVRRQFNTRLAIMANYTLGRSMDDGSTIYNFSAPHGTANAQYNPMRYLDWAVSNIDAKHSLSIAAVYTSSGPTRWLRGWKLSPIIRTHTGLPVNITQTNEITNVGQQRPNGDVSTLELAHPYVDGTALQWLMPYNDANFPLTPSGPIYSTINGVRTQIVATGLGNVPRDAIRGPGEFSFDASIARNLKIHENLSFQLRLDAFNVINHTNFTAPSTSLAVSVPTGGTTAGWNSAGFGRITGTQDPRRMQVSARFVF